MHTITSEFGPTTAQAVAAAPRTRSERHATLLCAGLSLLWFAATAWLRPLAIPDEGRYVGVAWEMLRSGDWWVPTLNGQPFFHKPPLFYWLTAAAMRLFGAGAWSARAASLLAATLLTTTLFAVVRRHAGARAAFGGVIVLATMPLFYGGAQYANLDMLVAACIGIAILLATDATLAAEQQRPHHIALAGAFAAAAAGMLAKGLIGIVLPALVLLGWALVRGRVRPMLRLVAWPPGWALLLAIAAPWFLAMQCLYPGFAHYFFIEQQAQRFVSTGFNNPQPLWFYLPVLALGTLPWSPWLLRAARHGHDDPNGLRALMWVWVVTVLAFFSVPDSKLIGYILPALAPFAYLVAEAVGMASPRASRTVRATAIGAAALCVGLALVAHVWQPKSEATLAARLKASRAPGEPVVFVDGFSYDVPFYAQLDDRVWVLDAWRADEIAHDSWRRELVDAERFGESTDSRHLLRDSELATLCGSSAWVVGPWPASPDVRRLTTAEPVFHDAAKGLWHLTPNGGSASGGCVGPSHTARP